MTDAIGPGEAARRLGVSTRTVQRWLREGRLAGVRVGSRLKVDQRHAQRRAAASAPPHLARPARPQQVVDFNDAVAHPTLEVWLQPEEEPVRRARDESSGLAVMQLPERLADRERSTRPR